MNGCDGWVKIHRRFLEWEWSHKPEMVSLFVHLLLMANHEDKQFQGQVIQRGSLVVSRHRLAKDTGISEQSVRTCLERLKSTSEITIKSTSQFTVLTIAKYDDYQHEQRKSNQRSNQHINQQVTSHQPAINQEQELKNSRSTTFPPIVPPVADGKDTLFPGNSPAPAENIPFGEIMAYLNERTGRVFKLGSEATRRLIRARWTEGFRLEDFRTVVANKCRPAREGGWLGDAKMEPFLRPGTLFGTKFEAYLNERGVDGGALGESEDQRYEREKWARWEEREKKRQAALDAEVETAGDEDAGDNGGGNGHGDRDGQHSAGDGEKLRGDGRGNVVAAAGGNSVPGEGVGICSPCYMRGMPDRA